METVLDEVCASCGSSRLPDGSFCLFCGDVLAEPKAAPSQSFRRLLHPADPTSESFEYAGFWLRVWAGAIDIVINLHTPEVLPLKPKWRREFLEGKIGADAEILNGLPIDKYIERMDAAGIELAFITASKSGSRDILPTGNCPMRWLPR